MKLRARMSNKGIELPVNMLVMLAIAVIVLLSAVAWFLFTFQGTSETQRASSQFQNCCSLYVQTGCSDSPSSFTGGGQCGDNLQNLANNIGITGESNIRDRCGCGGLGGDGSTGGGGGDDPFGTV